MEIINYIPSDYHRESFKNIIRLSDLKNNLKNVHEWKMVIRRIMINLCKQYSLFKSFDDFLNAEFMLSPPANDSNWQELIENYDCIIVGSDQVWNPTNQRTDIYFLNTERHVKEQIRLAYAVDSTNEFVQHSCKEKLCRALNTFNGISVRNEHTQLFVKKVTGETYPIVADPVVLSSFSEFCGQPFLTKERYVLVYILGKEICGGHHTVMSEIRKKYGNIKIYQVVMMKQVGFTLLDQADRQIYDCSPQEWVNLIYNAEFVYTDSFHCILFSIKFHKPFLSYYADVNRAPRLRALQKQYGLGQSVVSSVDEMYTLGSLEHQCEYEKIDGIFEKQTQEGIAFLEKHIGYLEGIDRNVCG